jgi:Sulfotransferase domain
MDAYVRLLSRDGFNATLDQPSCFVYKELMDYYPDAKVLLTQRNASSWARSMVEMSHNADVILYKPPFDRHPDKIEGPSGNWSKTMQGIRRDEVHMGGIQDSDNPLERKSSVSLATCERAYDEDQNRVKQHEPSHKLVQYSVSDGWTSLCDNFLPQGRICPSSSNEPFPHTNTAETSFLLQIRREARIRTILYQIHPWLSGKRIGKMIYRIRYQQKWSFLAIIITVVAAGTLFVL